MRTSSKFHELMRSHDFEGEADITPLPADGIEPCTEYPKFKLSPEAIASSLTPEEVRRALGKLSTDAPIGNQGEE